MEFRLMAKQENIFFLIHLVEINSKEGICCSHKKSDQHSSRQRQTIYENGCKERY